MRTGARDDGADRDAEFDLRGSVFHLATPFLAAPFVARLSRRASCPHRRGQDALATAGRMPALRRDKRASCARLAGSKTRPHTAPHTPHNYLPVAGAGGSTSGFAVLSPMVRTFENRSVMLMPESVSNNAGTCAAILVMSPVILFMPAASPLPV